MTDPFLKAPADLPQTVSRATANLKAAQGLLPGVERVRETPLLALSQLAALSAELPLDTRNGARHWRGWQQTLRVVDTDADMHRHAVSAWNRQAAGAYEDAVKVLIPTIDTELKQYDALQTRLDGQVKAAVKQVEVEKGRLGIK